MKFLHTADWHLGRYFHGASLLDDQAHVLDQLVALATSEKVDAELKTGPAGTVAEFVVKKLTLR